VDQGLASSVQMPTFIIGLVISGSSFDLQHLSTAKMSSSVHKKAGSWGLLTVTPPPM